MGEKKLDPVPLERVVNGSKSDSGGIAGSRERTQLGDPNTYRAKWKRLSGQSTANRHQLGYLIAKMVHHGSHDQVFEMIFEDIGEGELRNHLLAVLFREMGRREVSDIGHWYNKVLNPNERRAAEKGIQMGLGFLSALPADLNQRLSFLGERREEMLALSLGSFVSTLPLETGLGSTSDWHVDRYQEALGLIEGLENNSKLKERFLILSLGSHSAEVSLAAFAALDHARIPIEGTAFDQFVREGLYRDPDQMLARLAEAHAPDYLEAGLRQWLKIDSKAALEWGRENSSRLSPRQRDHLVLASLAHQADGRDFREAWMMLERVEDPEVRSRAESKIWESERKAVFAEVAENPEAFLGSIATGQSQHEDYWMKEGFKKWFSTSSAEANQWFEDNKRTLSPQQSQHIARAYAEVALEQGDIGLAREWSTRVVDPEFKQKLVDQIEAKAQESGE